MQVLAVIPARYESTRYPGKPLIDLAGKTMIRRVYEGVEKSNLISKVIVATDDQRIVDEVKSFGGDAAMTGKHHVNGTGRCVELASALDSFDIVINVQGDEPLIRSEQLDALIHSFQDNSVEISTLAIASSSESDFVNENRIKVAMDAKSNALYFSRSPIPNQSKTKNSVEFYKHIGIYAFRREILLETQNMEPCTIERSESLEQLRWMHYGKRIRVVETNIETPNIDSPEDVEKVLRLLRR
jgi:3-deoxy-manno-octulosonate cytidylyltransferase (CMP-KDO synthetase)